MRVVPHDLAILAGARLRFVGVNDEIMWPSIGFFRHERPLQSGGKAGTAPSAQSRCFHFVDDPIASLLQNRSGTVPCPAGTRTRQTPIMLAVQVSENAVAVVENHDCLFAEESAESMSVVGPPIGAES